MLWLGGCFELWSGEESWRFRWYGHGKMVWNGGLRKRKPSHLNEKIIDAKKGCPWLSFIVSGDKIKAKA